MRLIALPLLLPFSLLAGCGDEADAPAAGEGDGRKEVLGGTISDEMLPLATVTSAPPRAIESEDAGAQDDVADTAAAGEPPAEPAPEAAVEPAAEPE